MNSPERAGHADLTRGFFGPARPRIASAARPPQRGPINGGFNAFAIARIYSTFQLKRAEYFPEALGDSAFEILIDIFLYESLDRRIAPETQGGMRLPADAALPGSIAELLAADLVLVTPGHAPDSAPVVRLSRTGHTRLTLFFDHMADYISEV